MLVQYLQNISFRHLADVERDNFTQAKPIHSSCQPGNPIDA